MFGLPGQTLGQWETTLQRAIALGPDNLAAYCLTYEEDTSSFSVMPEVNSGPIRKQTPIFLWPRANC